MAYETRRMVATRPMRYERRDLVAGDTFECAVVDASYFMRSGRARAADTEPLQIPVATPVRAAPAAAVPAADPPAEPPSDGASSPLGGDFPAPEGDGPAAAAPRRSYTRRRASTARVDDSVAEGGE